MRFFKHTELAKIATSLGLSLSLLALSSTLVWSQNAPKPAQPTGVGPVNAPRAFLNPVTTPTNPASKQVCRADLSLDAITLSRNSLTTAITIQVDVKNLGSDAFSIQGSSRRGGDSRGDLLLVTTTHGANTTSKNYVPDSRLAFVAPGATQSFLVSVPPSDFDSFEFYGEVRAVFLFYGPGGCDGDINARNNEMRLTNAQVRDWITGPPNNSVVYRR